MQATSPHPERLPISEPEHVAAIDAVLSASRALVAIAARSLGSADEEITLPQYRSLVILASRGPLGLAELADALSVAPPTATRMCDRLVRKHLVRRGAVRNDRRRVRISLTERGQSLVDDVTRARRSELERVLDAMTADEQHGLAVALESFAAAAGELPDRDWVLGWGP